MTSIVPRFRRFDADMRLVDASLRRIFDEARDYASNPCVLPGGVERRRNRTFQPPGYDGLPVLKTGWATRPVPLRRAG